MTARFPSWATVYPSWVPAWRAVAGESIERTSEWGIGAPDARPAMTARHGGRQRWKRRGMRIGREGGSGLDRDPEEAPGGARGGNRQALRS